LNDGIIQQIGAPMELYHNPVNKFVAGFIGSPPMNFVTVEVKKELEDVYLNAGTFKLKVTEKQAKTLESYIGKKVTFGIRPADLKFTKAEKEGETIIGNLAVVEPLGSETNVFVETASTQITGIIEPDANIRVGDKIALVPDMYKAKFFDLETEEAIN